MIELWRRWWATTPAGVRARGFPIGRDALHTAERLRALQRRTWPWTLLALLAVPVVFGLSSAALGFTFSTLVLLLAFLPWLATEWRIRWLRGQIFDVVLIGAILLIAVVGEVTMIYATVRAWSDPIWP